MDRPRQGLVFCDWSMFYCERGGGIRTYHRAKMAWFERQEHHHYVLVAPGALTRIWQPCRNVTRVEVPGVQTGHGPDGYRVPIGLRAMLSTLRRFAPDVVEVSDPWVSGPLALAARRLGRLPGVLTSFFHTDSVGAYVRPWFRRRCLPASLREPAEDRAARVFWRIQSSYDWTLASSPHMVDLLQYHGIRRALVSPFGLDPTFLDPLGPRHAGGRPARLLYAGRLQPEKGLDLVLECLDAVVGDSGVSLTIAGAGPWAQRCATLRRPGVTFVGYVADRHALRGLYDAHDILLSPSPTETFGLTTLEGMARGIVVVGSAEGAIGDLMRQAASPFVFRAGDRAGFVQAVRTAVDADRRETSLRNRQVAERHGSWDEAVARQADLYARLVAEEDSSRRS